MSSLPYFQINNSIMSVVHNLSRTDGMYFRQTTYIYNLNHLHPEPFLWKPRRFRAATILPVTGVPMGMPNSSPRATRTAGAGCTTTIFSGSLIAAQTLSVSSFSVSAPTGQALMHWPQKMQLVSMMLRPKAGAIWVLKPRSTAPMAPICCT